jgi:hypothetical protein
MTNGITNLDQGTLVWEAGEADDFANGCSCSVVENDLSRVGETVGRVDRFPNVAVNAESIGSPIVARGRSSP